MNLDDAPSELVGLLAGWLGGPFTTPGMQANEPEPGAVRRLDRARAPEPEPAHTSVMESVIDSMVESVDSLLAAVPNPVPSAGQLRQARGRGVAQLARATDRARKPLLAGIGTADLIAGQLRRHLVPMPPPATTCPQLPDEPR
jgi:hypothetical protein